MNKELLNKILPYLGYGLKISIYDKYDKLALNDIATIVGIEIEEGRFMLKRDINCPTSFSINMEKNNPVLFSPDCLTKEIETEHGKEIPLIEMAKIAYNSLYIYAINTIVKDIILVHNEYVSIIDSRGIPYVFRPCLTIPWVTLEINMVTIPFNPIPVLDYLYSRHIAFNLMPEEYVSVESLKNNPYAKDNVQ